MSSKWKPGRKPRENAGVTKMTYSEIPLSLSLQTWLKDKGLLGRFKRNVIMLNERGIDEITSIYDAFRFELTHEGQEYWQMWAEMYEPIKIMIDEQQK